MPKFIANFMKKRNYRIIFSDFVQMLCRKHESGPVSLNMLNISRPHFSLSLSLSLPLSLFVGPTSESDPSKDRPRPPPPPTARAREQPSKAAETLSERPSKRQTFLSPQGSSRGGWSAASKLRAVRKGATTTISTCHWNGTLTPY